MGRGGGAEDEAGQEGGVLGQHPIEPTFLQPPEAEDLCRCRSWQNFVTTTPQVMAD